MTLLDRRPHASSSSSLESGATVDHSPASRADDGQAPSRAPRIGQVSLIEDHNAVTIGVSSMLAPVPDLRFRSGHPTVASLLAEIVVSGEGRPDVVLLDLRLADGSDPADNVRQLRAHGMAVVAYTSGEDRYMVRQACEGGVLGVVLKTSPPEDLMSTIRAALRGELTPSVDWASALDADTHFATTSLTDSERQVLALYATGAEASFVARRLHLSVNTVNTYVRRIRKKFMEAGAPAGSRIDLLVQAQAEGLVPTLGLRDSL